MQLLFHGQRVGGTDGVCPVTIGGEPGTDVDLSLHDLERAAEWMDATLVRRGVLRVAYDIHAIKAEQSVRGQFVTDVLESDLPDEMRERVLVTGPRALDRRGDLEVVYGPNESAKTAIHAGIYAALCGVRRARGAPARRSAAG